MGEEGFEEDGMEEGVEEERQGDGEEMYDGSAPAEGDEFDEDVDVEDVGIGDADAWGAAPIAQLDGAYEDEMSPENDEVSYFDYKQTLFGDYLVFYSFRHGMHVMWDLFYSNSEVGATADPHERTVQI